MVKTKVAPLEAWKRLGLGLHADQLIAQAYLAHHQVEGGRYLVPCGRVKLARKLSEMGYLVCDNTGLHTLGDDGWQIIILTQECWDRLRKDLT